jgi:hypothetical protein
VARVSTVGGAEAQAAYVRIHDERAQLVSGGDPDGPRLRCASVLKPLVFWAAAQCPPYDTDPAGWAPLAEPGVVDSDNDATVQVWTSVGGDRVLDRLAGLTGIRWPLEPGGTRSFGRVLIRAEEVAASYARFAQHAQAGDAVAHQLICWMRQVPDADTFGTRMAAATALRVDPATVAVKCGWFSDSDEMVLRTHAVTITPFASVIHVTAVLTALPMTEHERSDYDQLYRSGQEVLELHANRAANLLQARTTEMLVRDR